MKKNLVLALASFMLLSSCGVNSFGKEITSESDFVTIYKNTDSDFNVVKSNRVFKKSDTATDTSLASENHNVEIYSGEDFVYELTTKMTGFTIKYDVETYFLISGEKNGVVSEDASLLSEYRGLAYNVINTDYSAVLSVYENMKSFAGKKGNCEVNGTSYSNVSLTLADANTTLGYVLKYTYEKNGGTRTEDHYITLDKTDNKWGISFYSQRITDLIDGTEYYYVTEYQFTCMSDASLAKRTLNVKTNLSAYSFVAKGLSSDSTDLEDNNALSKK